jgi:hypothetical protein
MQEMPMMRVVLCVLTMLAAVWARASEPGEMQKKIEAAIDASPAPDKVKAFAKTKLLSICTNALLVKETLAQNDKKMALPEIQKIDKEWMDAETELPIQKEKQNNACAAELKKLAKEIGTIGELFVMDDKGGVVGENQLTSDYWQGDEEKWTLSFKNGDGGALIDKAKFDKSANAVLQQVSLPIWNSDGKIIGAFTAGVLVEKL